MERKLRHGKAAEAVARLRALLAPFAGSDCILPERFLTVKADDLVLTGWEGLDGALRRHDQPGRPVTALSIAFGWPGDNVPEPDAGGRLAPHIETSYFTDDIFPFSQSKREDLLDGYSYHGCTWGDDCEATDTVLSLEGVDDLHGALAALEARLLASDEPDEEGIRAGSLGACLLSALLFQAVDKRIAQDSLPRPLCVMAGSNGVYPYFDAPVVGIPDDARKAAETEANLALAEAGQAVPAPRYSSLVMTGIPRAKKRAVLVLEEQEEEMALRIARLRGTGHGEAEPAGREALPDLPAPYLPGAAPETTPEPIIAITPGGPLLAKKPVKPAWDFRDMLAPREPGDLPERSEPATGCEVPVAPVILGPVTSLAEPSLQQRLQALIAPPAPQEAEISEQAGSNRQEPIGPAWRSGRLWLMDDDAPPPPETPHFEALVTAPRRLWARLREWLRI